MSNCDQGNLINTPYQRVGGDMTWPKQNQGDLEWILRYGHEEDVIEKRMLLASIVNAYGELISKTQKDRNFICSELKK